MNEELVRKIRLRAMFTQEEFGKELGVSIRTVSQWETGKKGVGLKNQRKIVEFCKNHNIDIDKL